MMSKTRLDIEEEVLDAWTRSSCIEDEVLDIGNLADKVLEPDEVLGIEASSLMSKTRPWHRG